MPEPQLTNKEKEAEKERHSQTANISSEKDKKTEKDDESLIVQPEDDMETVMKKMTKAKQRYMKAEEDIQRLDSELSEAKKTREESHKIFGNIREAFNLMTKI